MNDYVNCVNSIFYTGDHLGSTSMVLDTDENISQSVTYIPHGEVFVEERNGAWNLPYLFNSKELDEETGLYYYGARYLNPTSGMWLSVDSL
jgi:RHS repeat-associated protein